MVAKKNIICTPYRVKGRHQIDKHMYTVEFKDPKNITGPSRGGLVEIEAGPTGLMLIDRKVFGKNYKKSSMI